MRIIYGLLTAIIMLAGIYFLFQAITTPTLYNLSSASAPQVTQVYSEATYYALVAAASFLLAILLYLATSTPTKKNQDDQIALTTETVAVLTDLGRTIPTNNSFPRRE